MTYNKKDVMKLMKYNGYGLVPNRGKGSHMVFSNGTRNITLSNSFNKMIMRRIIKEYGLVEGR